MTETIIAPATPSGKGGVAVLRISGPASLSVGRGLCGKVPGSWKIRPCSIVNHNKEVLDRGLVVFFKSPKSYTGEDVVEIHCHGNPLIVDLIISSAVSLGARVAEPGEFTKRAFLNNKIDLAQAESVADLIAADTSLALRGASESLSGKFSDRVHESIERLTNIRVLVEAGIDFPDEEGVPDSNKTVSVVLDKLNQELVLLEALVGSSRTGSILRRGLRVSIVGPPNCGKSTLLNYLAKEEVAIVSNTPGTTRDAVRAIINLSGVPLEVVDTAGLRSKGGGVLEKEGMKRALREASRSDLVLVMSVVGESFEAPSFSGASVLRVFNKVDLFDKDRVVFKVGCFYISAKSGEGVESLVEGMYRAVGVNLSVEVPVLARRRHVSLLKKARSFVKGADRGLRSGLGLELVAEDIRGAQNALGNITNPVSSDELLGKIFSDFCVGK